MNNSEITADEAAALSGFERAYVYQLAARGKIFARKQGGRVLFSWESVSRFMRHHAAGSREFFIQRELLRLDVLNDFRLGREAAAAWAAVDSLAAIRYNPGR